MRRKFAKRRKETNAANAWKLVNKSDTEDPHKDDVPESQAIFKDASMTIHHIMKNAVHGHVDGTTVWSGQSTNTGWTTSQRGMTGTTSSKESWRQNSFSPEGEANLVKINSWPVNSTHIDNDKCVSPSSAKRHGRSLARESSRYGTCNIATSKILEVAAGGLCSLVTENRACQHISIPKKSWKAADKTKLHRKGGGMAWQSQRTPSWGNQHILGRAGEQYHRDAPSSGLERIQHLCLLPWEKPPTRYPPISRQRNGPIEDFRGVTTSTISPKDGDFDDALHPETEETLGK